MSKLQKNPDGTYSATVFSADNKRNLAMLSGAAERLLKDLDKNHVFGYLQAARPKGLEQFYTNNLDDVAARVVALTVEEGEPGFVNSITAQLEFFGPKKNILETVVGEKVDLYLKPRAVVLADKGYGQRHIHYVTGLYFTHHTH